MNGIGMEFLEQTKYDRMRRSDSAKGLPEPPIESDWDRSREPIRLPKPKDIRLGGTSLRDAIEGRRSLRSYSSAPISLEELSYLLWCTQGVQRVVRNSLTLRTVPSAGARHAFETLLCVNRVSGLGPGLYRFLALDHALVEEQPGAGFAAALVEACLGQEFVESSAATFIWTAEVRRMTYRYGERGSRYLYLDAGHVCQNLYLAAEAIGCGACALAAFDDDAVNRLLGLDGVARFAIYLGAVGKK